MDKRHDQSVSNKDLGRVLAAVIAIMLIPFIVVVITGLPNWSLSDFIAMCTLLIGIGSIFLVSSKRVRSPMYRIVIAFVCVALLLYVWAELAVGVFTNLGS